jgi:hypothetical protein
VSSGAPPQTPGPNTSVHANATLDGDTSALAAQPSPMSSAFPAAQKSTTVL